MSFAKRLFANGFRRECRLALAGVCSLIIGAALPLHAQVTPPRTLHRVAGTVFDSVANKPLAGAVVQVAMQDSAGAPSTATTDISGRYVVPSLPAGRYLVGFYHDALTSLGLDAPTQAVTLASDTLATVDLAIPSSRTIVVLRCGDASARPDRGMLVGTVRDAESRGPIAGAGVQLSWGALALDSANYRTVREEATVTIEADGSYLACKVPLDAALDLTVTAPGHRTVAGPVVVVPANGIARLDVQLADSAASHGTSIISGRVMRTSGKAVPTGRAVIAALNREVAVQDGAFVLADLPTGSWVVETRVIGNEPQQHLVDATDSAVTPLRLTVSERTQRLEVVTVVGKIDRNTRVLEDILRRQRTAAGTTFLPGSPVLRGAMFTTDVFKEARGFKYKSPTEIEGRTQQGIGLAGRCRGVSVFVNDEPLPAAFEMLDEVVPVRDVLAIETYPDISLAPLKYRYGFGYVDPPRRPSRNGGAQASERAQPCAVVAVWTKRDF